MVFGNLKGIHIKINQEVGMNEQQGNLMPQLSGLPGPKPFKRGKTKMEDNKNTSSNPIQDDGKPDMSKPVTDSVDDIVAKTAKALGAGKAFGGWTDDVEEQVKISKLTIPVKLGKGQPAYKEKVSRDDAKAAADMFDSLRGKSKKKPVKESNIAKQMARVKALAMKQAKKAAKDAPLVKIGPDSSRPTHQQQYTKNIRPSDLKKKVNEGILKVAGKAALSAGKGIAKDAAKQRATELAYSGIKKVTSRNKKMVSNPAKDDTLELRRLRSTGARPGGQGANAKMRDYMRGGVREGWVSKIASAAKGAVDAGKGAAKIGGGLAKGAVGAGKLAKAGFSALPTGGKVAVGGAAAALAGKALLGRGRDKKRKAMSSALYGGGGDSNPLSGRNVRGRMFGEEVQQLDELPILAPLAGMAGKALAGGVARKAIGGIAKNVAGEALGKMFKKSKNPGEEGKE